MNFPDVDKCISELTITPSLAVSIEHFSSLDQAVDVFCRANDTVDQAQQDAVLRMSPYFGVPWPSGLVLARHLAGMGASLQGLTVLELGCGLGIPSLVAAKLGAKVTATDFHPQALQMLKSNQMRNFVTLQAVEWDWTEVGSPAWLSKKFDWVIASDVLYEQEHPATLAGRVSEALRKAGHVLVTDPGRSYLQAFVQQMEQHGFRHDLFLRTANDLEGKEKEIFLLSFQKRGG
jgi:predicted nicotinamide N-methyase